MTPITTTLAGSGGSTPLSSGVVGYWHLSDLTDASGNSYTLTNLQNGGGANVSFVAGQVGNCASFNIVNSLSITNASGPLLAFSGAFTLATLWQTPDSTQNISIVHKGTDGTAGGEYGISYGSSVPTAIVTDSGGNIVGFALDTNTGDPGNAQWVLTFMWFNPSAGANGTVYIRSGKVAGSALNTEVSSALTGPRTVAGTDPFTIGGTGLSGVKIDETVAWNRVLSTADQNTIFTNVKAGSVPF